jgi:hypothetical protein
MRKILIGIGVLALAILPCPFADAHRVNQDWARQQQQAEICYQLANGCPDTTYLCTGNHKWWRICGIEKPEQ